LIPVQITNQQAENLAKALEMIIPMELTDSLVGEKIPNSPYFKLKEGDPTKGMCGYVLNEAGKKIYKIEHQPTFSKTRYRKVNSLAHGECWEAITE
jgi:hypothetical protein